MVEHYLVSLLLFRGEMGERKNNNTTAIHPKLLKCMLLLE